jgi:cell division protein ZapA
MEKRPKRTMKISLLGKEYLIKTDIEEERARRIADYVNEKIEEIGKNTNTVTALNVVLLTALNIAEDYFSNEAMLVSLEERSENLIRAIEAQIT